MKSKRLNEDMRTRIISNIFTGFCEKEIKEIAQLKSDLGLKIYRSLYDEDIEKQMRSFPEGFFAESDQIEARMNGKRIPLKLTEPRLFRFDHFTHFSHVDLSFGNGKGEDFIKEFQKIDLKEDKLKEKIRKAKHKAKGVIWGCKTTKQLKETWPEIKSFIEPFEKEDYSAMLPAVQTDDLNKQLKLPR